ncbi:hypothetical protein JW796_04600 [Candidatus Dojkabacteria bacterium]|nr:hypothetical protein [Candidatus Dojkabacteria bacterium]
MANVVPETKIVNAQEETLGDKPKVGISDQAVMLYILTAPANPVLIRNNVPPGLSEREKKLNSMEEQERKKFIRDIRDDTFPETRRVSNNEAVFTIGEYIETLEQLLEDIQLSNSENLANRIEKLKNSSIYELDWRNYTGLSQNDFNRLVSPLNLLIHEHFNLLALTSGYAQLVEDVEDEQSQQQILDQITVSSTNSINLLRLVERFTKHKDSNSYKITELMGTLVGANPDGLSGNSFSIGGKKRDIKLNFDFGNKEVFDSFEEFVSVRTLIHNAAIQTHVKSITVRRFDIDDAGKNKVYQVQDDGEIGNFRPFVRDLERGKRLGKEYKNEPILISQRGGKIVALMAGTRGDEIVGKIDSKTGVKSVFVTFSDEQTGGKKVFETFKKGYLDDKVTS